MLPSTSRCPTKKCNSFSLSSSYRPPKAEAEAEGIEEAEEEDGLRRDEYRCEDQEDISLFFFFFFFFFSFFPALSLSLSSISCLFSREKHPFFWGNPQKKRPKTNLTKKKNGWGQRPKISESERESAGESGESRRREHVECVFLFFYMHTHMFFSLFLTRERKSCRNQFSLRMLSLTLFFFFPLCVNSFTDGFAVLCVLF